MLHSGIAFCSAQGRVTREWALVRKRQLSLGELLPVADMISEALGAPDGGDFYKWLEGLFHGLSPTEPTLAHCLMDLDVPLVTTNYDSTLSEALKLKAITWMDRPLVDEFVHGRQYILHLHGHFERPESVVLGTHSYAGLKRDEHIQTVLRALLAGRSLLFVGMGDGVADPNFAELFEHFRRAFSHTRFSHFVLCRNQDVSVFRRRYPSGTYRLEPICYGTEHSSLIGFLRDLSSVTSSSIPRSSGVRIAPSRLPNTGEHLVGRDSEMKKLWAAWNDPDVGVVTIVGAGGAGKTQLLKKWRAEFLVCMGRVRGAGSIAGKTRLADRVFDWTFETKSNSGTAMTSDEFFVQALKWFGNVKAEDVPDPRDRGERLAASVKERPTLLILDGIESLQNPPDVYGGACRDPALQALLNALLDLNPGLCVVSTRTPVTELAFDDLRHVRLEIPGLSPEDGAKFLAELGVSGPNKLLKEASRDYWGNPLTLQLLGTLLKDRYEGDIHARSEVFQRPLNDIEPISLLLKSYESWFLKSDRSSIAAWSILRLLAFFDRPAQLEELRVLAKTKSLAPVTGSLLRCSEPEWMALITRLHNAHLISIVEDSPNAGSRDARRGANRRPGQIDTHPLIRQWLISALCTKRNIQLWRAGHTALYKHFSAAAMDQPETFDEMLPLYRAINHAAHAGKHGEALVEVFQRRVRRGDIHYSVFRIGGVMSDLVALSRFLEGGAWSNVFQRLGNWYKPKIVQIHEFTMASPSPAVRIPRPVNGLNPDQRSYVLNEVGSALRFLGLPMQAIPFVESALRIRRTSESREVAGRSARNLSKAYLQAGLLQPAEERGREALDCAPLTAQKAERYISLANLARILHCRGEWVEAGKLFERAEQLRQTRRTGFTLQEAHFCDFLIETDQAKVVSGLLALLTSEPEARIDVLNHGLYHYSCGRIEMHRNRVTQALRHLDKAIVSLQRSGRAEELCSALIVRAGAYRMAGRGPFAENDLTTASDIANRGLRLLQVECALEAVSISFSTEGRHSRELLKAASEQLGSLGYKRFIGRVLAMSRRDAPERRTDTQSET